jgi:hypothetical protein
MRRSHIVPLLALALAVACHDDPAATPAKAIRAVSTATQSATVGKPLPGGVTVKVVDYSDRGLANQKVGFSILGGDGSVSERLALTDGEGVAHIEWTIGQTAGANQLVASMFGIDPDSGATFLVTGTPDVAVGLAITPRVLRIPSGSSTGSLVTSVVDQYGNAITGTPTYTARNTTLVSVNSTGTVTKGTGTGSTWVIASAQGFTDSAQVFVLSPTDPPCTGISATSSLAVGQVMTAGFADNGVCISAAVGEREYAVVPFFDSPVPSAQTSLVLNAFGVKATASTSLGAVRVAGDLGAPLERAIDYRDAAGVDARLRESERANLAVMAPAARQWYRNEVSAGLRRATRAITTPTVGDQLQLNVDDQNFCASPVMRTGRVVAVTAKAVVIADLANPAGFTDADYASMGATFDTLAYPSDTVHFGASTDVDNNGRVVLFFTHAVNELGNGVLGFAYARDLLPKSGPLGSCPGSNVAEMLYLPVPDDARSPGSIKQDVFGTMAHEFQHVINASRRLYINQNAAPAEERWLNEGLSHIAEDLLFFRATATAPKQNLGTQLLSTTYQQAYLNFLRQNFARYFRFTRFPDAQSPVGLTDDDDDLETRGATWSFLRYAADQRFSANETAFWQSLVNSNSTGMQNLYEHVGADARAVIRDWTMSNYLDDLVPTDAKYTQPSWNLRGVPGFAAPLTFPITASATPVNLKYPVTLTALGTAFMRFAVGTGQEAYVNVTGFGGVALPRNVLLAVVRTK